MKVPYQIRLESEMLDQLRELAKKNGTSVNHEIRQAIRKQARNK
jgi:predicted DNA-binding protein